MSDEPKTTKVSLMIEAEIRGDVDEEAARESVRFDLIEAMDLFLDKACQSRDEGTGAAILNHADHQVRIHNPEFLPDDIHDILKRDKNRNLSPAEQLKRAVIEYGKRPPLERFQAMIDRGAINEKGEVLLRGPWDDE